MLSIGDRMKQYYEDRNRIYLTRRTPVIMRLDGRAFHTVTRNCERPFDHRFNNEMCAAAFYLALDIQGAKLAYVQSDEVSFLITDYDTLTTEAWFDYNVQKMTSIAASRMSVSFSLYTDEMVEFDCRVFNIPKEDVCNYFIWRQKDWTRNSITMLAQKFFSTKQLYRKSISDVHDMLHGIGVNWNNLEPKWKNGRVATVESNWSFYGGNIIFTTEEGREKIEKYLYKEE